MFKKLLCFIFLSLYACSPFLEFIESIKLKYHNKNQYCLSNYAYPHPTKPDDYIKYIAIAATNDIHGAVTTFNETIAPNKTIRVSGLTLFSSYLEALSEEWKENLIWLDAGDQYQGSMESNLFGGEPIIEFFNSKKKILKVATLGNHDFDFGFGNLSERLTKSNFDHVVSNINNIYNDKPVDFPNTFTSKIYKVGGIKVGIIGLITTQTPFTTATDVSGLIFKDYLQTTVEKSKALRAEGAEIVILVSHIGMKCVKGDLKDLVTLKLRNQTTPPGTNCSDSDELPLFFNSLPNGTVDALVGGHHHDFVHHFVNGVPVVIGENFARHFNVIYLAYDLKTKKILKEKTIIEGPIPICEHLPVGESTCFLKNMKNIPDNATKLQNFTFHGKTIEEDQKVLKDLDVYIQKGLEFKSKILAQIINPMHNSREEESPLGNYVCDVLQKYTKSKICIFNKGGIRIDWVSGDLSYYALYQTLPFENNIMTFEFTGKELLDSINILQKGSKGFYHTSGLRQEVCQSPKHSLISVKLSDGEEIDLNKIYTVVTNDFLVAGGDDFKDVLTVAVLKNKKSFRSVREILFEDLVEKKRINSNEEPCIKSKNPRLIIRDCSSA